MDTPHRTAPSRPIQDWERYDYPDPADMSVVEAEICNRMNYCGNEIDTINEVIRTMVFQTLKHWGFFANKETMRIDITVKECEEAITWIEQPRHDIDFNRLSQHILGLNAIPSSHPDNHRLFKIQRGGDMGQEFNLTIHHTGDGTFGD